MQFDGHRLQTYNYPKYSIGHSLKHLLLKRK